MYLRKKEKVLKNAEHKLYWDLSDPQFCKSTTLVTSTITPLLPLHMHSPSMVWHSYDNFPGAEDPVPAHRVPFNMFTCKNPISSHTHSLTHAHTTNPRVTETWLVVPWSTAPRINVGCWASSNWPRESY